MMVEIDEQCQELTGRPLNLIICPVGVGSLARTYILEPILHIWHWVKVSTHLLEQGDVSTSMTRHLAPLHLSDLQG